MTDLRSYFRCYDPRFLAWVLLGAAVTVVAAVAAERFESRTVPRLALGALQALSMGAITVGLVLRMRHLDELQRRIQFESVAIAFAITGAALQGWGFFEKAGLPRFDWSAWGWPFMFLSWGAAFLFVRRRYA